MGLFDEIVCKHSLPGCPPIGVYQTKSLDCTMDVYVIEADGTLWREDCDTEDQSDFAKGIGPDKFAGCLARVNKRLVQVKDFRGEIFFYMDDWEFSALFDEGKLLNVKRVTE